MGSQIRRVVTGKDETGKAIAWIDDFAPNVNERKELGTTNILLWVTDSTPADIREDRDAGDRTVGLQPPPNGSTFRIVEFAPESEIPTNYETRHRLMRERGIFPEGEFSEKPRHPSMHRTKTIDYALVLSGEIHMLLDDSDVHLRAGDVVVQRATNHAWVNRSTKPCTVAFVMIDAKA